MGRVQGREWRALRKAQPHPHTHLDTPIPHPPQVHGDVKPENVMLAGSGTVKIGDFGQSQFFGHRDVFNRTLGTPAYLGALRWDGKGSRHQRQPLLIEFGAPTSSSRHRRLPRLPAAPEVCAGESYRGRQADMWALGVSLYLFIFGELPFQVQRVCACMCVCGVVCLGGAGCSAGPACPLRCLPSPVLPPNHPPAQGESVLDLYDAIAGEEVPYPRGTPISMELQDLFLRLLHKDPRHRITAAEVHGRGGRKGPQEQGQVSRAMRCNNSCARAAAGCMPPTPTAPPPPALPQSR